MHDPAAGAHSTPSDVKRFRAALRARETREIARAAGSATRASLPATRWNESGFAIAPRPPVLAERVRRLLFKG